MGGRGYVQLGPSIKEGGRNPAEEERPLNAMTGNVLARPSPAKTGEIGDPRRSTEERQGIQVPT